MGIAFGSYTANEALEGRPALMKEYAYLEALVLDGEQISRYSDILTEYDTAELDSAAGRYHEICARRRAECCSSFEMKGSRFSGEITLDKPALVFFSVPWSEGWSAEVNGEEAAVENVDNGLMAVRCEAGKSSISFTYENRYLRAGMIITFAAAGMLFVYLLLCRITAKRPSDSDNTGIGPDDKSIRNKQQGEKQ